jgi:hypothetical protein
MATDPQVYTIMNVLVAGSLLTEHTSATLKRNTKSNAVETVAKGYAGEAPGAASCELDIENVVPQADIEFDAGDYIDGLIPIEFGIVAFGSQLTFKGFIIGDTLSGGVNKATTYNFNVRGSLAKFA